MTNFKSMREKGCNGCVHNYTGFMLHVIKIYQHFVNNQTPPLHLFFILDDLLIWRVHYYNFLKPLYHT